MDGVVNINDLLDGHTGLDLECLDRLYLNAYVPNLQTSGQVARFLTEHLGKPIASPALFAPIGERFRAAVATFAEANAIPVVRFAKGARKADVMRPYLEAAKEPGVVAIGLAQESQSVFTGSDRATTPGAVWFSFAKSLRRVSVYYFYLWDDEFGPGFIKLCSYFPYPAKVWLNGHEWAKRQATKAGLAFDELANGFADCEDPARLQAICDGLGPAQIERFFARWMAILPTPLGPDDQAAGYWWELSMRQVEVSRTIVFDAPRRARAFFEALVTDNLDLGRPDEVALIFERRVQANTPGTFSTKVVTRGTEVTVNVFYKHSRIKEYLKEGRALRIETVVNGPTDLGCQRRLVNLPELQTKARAANRRLLIIQRAGQGCAIATELFERVALPSIEEGRRTGALRFTGPPRHGPGRRPVPARPCRQRLHQPEPSCPDGRTARQALHERADDLRPAPAAAQGPHPAPRALEYLRAHPRGHPRRHLLHQAPRPAAPPAPRGRPAARPTGAPQSARRHQPQHRWLRRPRPPQSRSVNNLTYLSTFSELSFTREWARLS